MTSQWIKLYWAGLSNRWMPRHAICRPCRPNTRETSPRAGLRGRRDLMPPASLFRSWLHKSFVPAFLLTLLPPLTMTSPGQSHLIYLPHIPRLSSSLEVRLFPFKLLPRFLTDYLFVNRTNYSWSCSSTYIDTFIPFSRSYCYTHSTFRPSRHTARAGTSHLKTFTTSRCSWCRCAPSSQSFRTGTARSPSLASWFLPAHHSIGTTISTWRFLYYRNGIPYPPYGKTSYQWT